MSWEEHQWAILKCGSLDETYHLIDEYKNPGLCMLGTLWVAINCDPKSRIEMVFNAIYDGHSSGTSGFLLLRVKQKYVRTRKCCYLVEMIDNACFDCIRVIINDQVRVNINNCTSLDEKLAQPLPPQSFQVKLYKCNRCLVQDSSAHLVNHIRITRHADIRDKTLQRAALQCRNRLWL